MNRKSAITILIVDDDKEFGEWLSLQLRGKGINTLNLDSGDGLFDVLKSRCPDGIIMDLQLPGKSGLQLTTLLKAEEQFQNLPVVAVSSFGTDNDKDLAISSGCVDFFDKPLNIEQIVETFYLHTQQNEASRTI